MIRSAFAILLTLIWNIAISQDTLKIFYPNGAMRYSRVIIDSNYIYEREYYENGQLRGESYGWLTDKKPIIKESKTFFDTGELMDLRTDSIEIRYEPDGRIYQITPIKRYMRNGLSKIYMANKLWLEINYRDDLRDGWQISYDTTGKKVSFKEFYRNGKLVGPSTHFGHDQQINKIIYYNDSCPVKVEYYQNGKIKEIITKKEDIWMREGKQMGCN